MRPFTMLAPRCPGSLRGTVAALAHPAAIDHLQPPRRRRGRTDADRRLDRRAPSAAARPRQRLGLQPRRLHGARPAPCAGRHRRARATTVAALHAAGIGVILDVVFNHTGESDAHGPTLSLRGLDNAAYYRHRRRRPAAGQRHRHRQHARLRPARRQAPCPRRLRHFVRPAGVDGFRFDLAADPRPRRRSGFIANCAALRGDRGRPAARPTAS